MQKQMAETTQDNLKKKRAGGISNIKAYFTFKIIKGVECDWNGTQ